MIPQAKMYIVAVMLLIASPLAGAEETATRKFDLPNYGQFQLQAPQSWRAELKQPPENLPPTIVFMPGDGESFQVIVTPMYPVRDGVPMPSLPEIKERVEQAAEAVKEQAVEESIAITELKGPSATGFYFSVTDRAPKAGEFKYMTQGIVRVGALAPAFTILTNDGAGDVVAQSLEMLGGAMHTANTSPEPDVAPE